MGTTGVIRDLADRGMVKIGEYLERSPLKTAAVNYIEKKSPSAAKFLGSKIFNMDSEFVKSEAGKDIKTSLQTVQENAARLHQQYTEAALAKKPIMIPIAGGGTKSLINPGEMHAHAMKTARAQEWGSRDQHLQTLLYAASKQGGDNHAQMLSSHLMVELHDTTPPGTGMNSIANNFRLNNKPKNATPSFIPKDTNPYKAPRGESGDIFSERKLAKYSATIFAGKAALAHSTNFMLTSLNNSLLNFGKGALATLPIKGNLDNSKLFLKMMEAIPELETTEYRELVSYEASKLKGVVDKHKWVPGSVGQIIHSNFSMPGFPMVRRLTLIHSGMTAKYTLDELATDLMHSSNPALIEAKLKQVKLDPNKIRMQNGHLNNDDYATGIFNAVNRDIGMTGTLHRTQFSQATMAGRMMMQYHGSITRIRKSIYDGLIFDFKNKDYVSLAKRISVLALAFPEAGSLVNMGEDIWNGKGINKSIDDYENREHKMWGSKGALGIMSSRLEAMAHMGAIGVSLNYGRSLGRNQLIKQLAGPLPSSAAEVIQDSLSASKVDSVHPNRADQLGRDLIHMSLPAWVSGLVAHEVLPTKAERDINKPRSSRSLRSSARRKAIKAANPSSNPLNRLTAELNEDN